MNNTRALRFSRLLLSTAVLVCAFSARADELPLTRVVLSTSGVAQFTHAGRVSPRSSVDLAVRLDQVDDILKSLTVFDREGAIGAVSLPGRAPLTELFRDLPFGPEALDLPRALLNALVGSEIEIAGQVTAKGRVFKVEDEEVALPDKGGTVTRHRLTLMTDRGLVQAILEDVTALRFSDPQAKAQVERALTGLTENRAKERRGLSIGFLGEEPRNVAISYMVAAPIWKTAYRLVLPKDGSNARLQGWAVLENLTGGNWQDIELVLVSGNPVALRQPLYTAFFADRPEIPVVAATRIVPRTDDQEEAPIIAHGRTAAKAADVAARFSPAVQQAQIAAQRPAAPLAAAPPPASSRVGSKCGRGRGSIDAIALPVPRQDIARDRTHHDGAVRRSRDRRGANVDLSARNVRTSSARRCARAQRRRQRPAAGHRDRLRVRSMTAASISSAMPSCRCCRRARSSS